VSLRAGTTWGQGPRAASLNSPPQLRQRFAVTRRSRRSAELASPCRSRIGQDLVLGAKQLLDHAWAGPFPLLQEDEEISHLLALSLSWSCRMASGAEIARGGQDPKEIPTRRWSERVSEASRILQNTEARAYQRPGPRRTAGPLSRPAQGRVGEATEILDRRAPRRRRDGRGRRRQ
jgi:hypothetical protein